jgi:hypothetical protein
MNLKLKKKNLKLFYIEKKVIQKNYFKIVKKMNNIRKINRKIKKIELLDKNIN